MLGDDIVNRDPINSKGSAGSGLDRHIAVFNRTNV